ncbi:MAG: NUDIX hydrolase [Pseudomonadota bacterium]
MAPTDDPRAYPSRPWVGVGAIVLRDDTVLLIKRAKPPEAGRWSLPGGTLELGETCAEAAVREVAEETGIKAEALSILTAVDRIDCDEMGQVRYHYLLVDVVARYVSGEPVAADDAADAQWVDLSDLDEMAIWSETKRVIIEAVAKHGNNP